MTAVVDWQRALRDEPKPKGSPLTSTVVAVGMVLSTYADLGTGSNARPARGTMAKGVGVGVDTVHRALGALCALGWLERVTSRPGHPVSYQLTVPGEPPSLDQRPDVENPAPQAATPVRRIPIPDGANAFAIAELEARLDPKHRRYP